MAYPPDTTGTAQAQPSALPAAALLLGAAGLAVAWANSPWRHGYDTLRHSTLHGVVNDGGMAIFFLAVGAEIARELVHGDLRHWRTAALPAIAAAGGVLLPAAIYLALNAGGPGLRGWAIPTATDIAFATGVLALAGRRAPPSLRLFLLTLAVVDDLVAIVIIAVAYSTDINVAALGTAIALLAVIAALRRRGTRSLALLLGIGALAWLATVWSGVHPTIAGAAVGLLLPVDPQPSAPIVTIERIATFAVLPLFALVNAGIDFGAAGLEATGATAVGAGVFCGLVLGKPIGILAASWLAVRVNLGHLPAGASWSDLGAAGALAGIGFTVSLFVTELAFGGGDLETGAKLGIVAGSVVAGIGGALILRREQNSSR